MTNLDNRLRDLEQLKERGTITEDEYQRRRAAVIDEEAGRKRGGPLGTILKGGAIGCLAIVGAFIFLSVVIAAIIVVTMSGGGESHREDARVAYEDGSSGTVETALGVKNKVTITKISDPAPTEDQLFQPDAGYRCIALDITIENAGERETLGGDFLLRARDGFEYEPEFLKCAGASELNLLLHSLTSGGKTSGVLAFHVPEAAEVEWLKFDPNPFAKGDLYFDAP